jgi:hypothetical protein
MKRLARQLFTLCAALSLLLCVTVCVLWVRGAHHLDLAGVNYARSPRTDRHHGIYFEVRSYSGTLRFRFTRAGFDPVYFQGRSAEWMTWFRAEYPTGLRWTFNATKPPSRERPGFDAGHEIYSGGAGHYWETWHLAVRAWLPIVLLLVLPAMWLNGRRKARRARRLGLCPACGYDMRASPQRCPECGAAAEASRAVAASAGDGL